MIVRRCALVDLPAAHVFDVIEAAEHYPQFLPWCAAVQIVDRTDSLVSADLHVHWGGLRLAVRTRNPKTRPVAMSIHLERGPFRHFEGQWRLTALTAGACKVDFMLDCEFDSGLMTQAAGPVFNRVANTLVDAFVQRAHSLPVTMTDSDPQRTADP